MALSLLSNRFDYTDATRACPFCGMLRSHRTRRDCVQDLVSTIPDYALSDTIDIVREQLSRIEAQRHARTSRRS